MRVGDCPKMRAKMIDDKGRSSCHYVFKKFFKKLNLICLGKSARVLFSVLQSYFWIILFSKH